jgi:3-(3-hydroxy-phenyl)propionate hydroxylase
MLAGMAGDRRGYQVVQVGLGPVGAVHAALLGVLGVPTLVVERDRAPYPLPRAVAADDEVLRVLLGLPGCGDLLDGMNVSQRVGVYDRRGRLLVDVGFPETDLGLPGLAFFHQPTLERRLRQTLAGLPSVRVALGCELVGLAQDAGGVRARLRDAAGERVVAGGWLAGCDGAGSTVRRALGVPYRGSTFEQRWLVVDVATAAPLPDRPYFSYVCDPARPAVDMPVPGGHRFEWLLRPDEPAERMTRPAAVRALLATRVHPDAVRVVRATVYAYHARRAARWRVGRAFLLGDAAHAMPPFAGQGLGAGIRDAANLAWKLAAVVRGAAGPALLDSYQREREPGVRRMTGLSLALGAALSAGGPAAAVRDGLLAGLVRAPAVGPWLRRGRLRRPRPPGARLLPRPRVRDLAGRVAPLDRWLGPDHALVGYGVAPPVDGGLPAVRLCLVPPGGRRGLGEIGVEVLEDLDGTVMRVLSRPGSVAVVRPDRYLAAVLRPAEVAEGLAAYEAWVRG